MTTKIRQYGDPIETRDGQMLVYDEKGALCITPRSSADTVLTTSSRIVPGMIINAEKSPEVVPGSMGVVLAGNAGPAARQIEIVVAALTSGDLAGFISAADLAAVREIFAKYSSSRGAMGRLGQANSDDAPDALTCGQHDAVAAINSANADFWAKKATAERL
jgi:hypothetical protein